MSRDLGSALLPCLLRGHNELQNLKSLSGDRFQSPLRAPCSIQVKIGVTVCYGRLVFPASKPLTRLVASVPRVHPIPCLFISRTKLVTRTLSHALAFRLIQELTCIHFLLSPLLEGKIQRPLHSLPEILSRNIPVRSLRGPKMSDKLEFRRQICMWCCDPNREVISVESTLR